MNAQDRDRLNRFGQAADAYGAELKRCPPQVAEVWYDRIGAIRIRYAMDELRYGKEELKIRRDGNEQGVADDYTETFCDGSGKGRMAGCPMQACDKRQGPFADCKDTGSFKETWGVHPGQCTPGLTAEEVTPPRCPIAIRPSCACRLRKRQ